MALRAQAWFADSNPGEFPLNRAEVAQSAGLDPQTDSALGLCCALAEREALLRFDTAALEAWIDTHRQVGAPHWRQIGQAWRRWLSGEPAETDLGRLEAEVRAHKDAVLTIETSVLRALFAMSRGDLSEALKLSRRASRMSRTEGLPQSQYLANLVLARLRRLHGRPHLAVHILTALLRVAPKPWRRWMHWEMAIAGGMAARWERPAATLVELAQAAAAGEAQAFRTALQALSPWRTIAPLDAEITALHALIDPAYDGAPEALEWPTAPGVANTPYGLHGLCRHHADPAMTTEPVWVHVHPERVRRLLALGLPLLRDTARLEPGRRRRGRTDAATAALALEGDVPEDAFFERLYGFPYQARVHQSARKTLYHRIRQRVDGVAALVKEGETLRLEVQRPFAIPDPRGAPPPENTILAFLARDGATTAKRAAEVLGLPVRTAQHTLKALASDGFLRAEKVGRQLHYHVADTTFDEASRH